MFELRHQVLVFKPDAINTTLAKLKNKFIDQWEYKDASFLVGVYKDSKRDHELVNDAHTGGQISARLEGKSPLRSFRPPASVFSLQLSSFSFLASAF